MADILSAGDRDFLQDLVSQIVAALGELRPSAGKKRKGRLTSHDRDEIRELLAQGGHTLKSVAERFGISRTTVHFIAKGMKVGPSLTEKQKRHTLKVDGSEIDTPSTISPLDLVQEHLRSAPWIFIVATVLFNRKRDIKLQFVIEGLFERYPTAEDLASAKPAEVAPLLAKLGFHNKRAKALIALAAAWVELVAQHGEQPPFEAVLALSKLAYGVSPFALDCYRIFVLGRIRDDDPQCGDEKLDAYCKWARSLVFDAVDGADAQ